MALHKARAEALQEKRKAEARAKSAERSRRYRAAKAAARQAKVDEGT
jgi:hypothetical protein